MDQMHKKHYCIDALAEEDRKNLVHSYTMYYCYSYWVAWMKMLRNMHSFGRKKDEEGSCSSCYQLTQGGNQDNFDLKEVGCYTVDNYDDLVLAPGYSLGKLKVADDAFDAEDSLEYFDVMDEISFEEDNSCFPLEDGLALLDDDNLDNSFSNV